MHMGPVDLAQTRLFLLPMTARIMATAFPEMAVALEAFPANVLQELPLLTDRRHLPDDVRRNSFVA